jgi:hypothetical protein
MKKLPSVHPVFEYHGSPRACGRQYGEEQAESIEGFLYFKLKPDAQKLRYAARCWEYLKGWEKPVADFVRGSSEGSGLGVAELTLILLNDEIFHLTHCTAIGATRSATLDGSPVIGENWDWVASLYPWASLTRLRMKGAPRQLLYSYPGLWASAGMNEHGVSVLWTSSGFAPKLKPVAGIPSYALVAGMLLQRDCKGVLELLRRTRNAGCFNFFIADASGEVWVIEGCPGKIEAERCADLITRANHYETPRMCRLSKQDLEKKAPPDFVSIPRTLRMRELGMKHHGRITGRLVEQFLRDTEGPHFGRICDPKCIRDDWMPLDSLYCLPVQREFRIARGIQTRHEYTCYKV